MIDSKHVLIVVVLSLATFAAPAAGLDLDDRHTDATQRDLVETAVAAGKFNTLLAAAKAVGLVEALQGKGPLTVFAPTDEAFAKLGSATIESLLRPENRGKLAAILKYHVVAGRVSASDAVRASSATPLLAKTKLTFTIREGRLRVQDATVIANDVGASNGVIHVIDSVLMPPETAIPQPRGRKVIGVYLDTPGQALAAQLGIDRRKASVVTSTTKRGNARAAGLKQYDVIVGFDRLDGSNKSLTAAKKARAVGEIMDLTVIRRGKRITVHVPVGLDPH